MADFATDMRKGNPKLELAVLDWAIALAPAGTTIPTDFTDSGGVILALPDDFIPVGNLDKKAAVKVATAINSTPVETYGEQGPTRIIRKSRDTTVDFSMQESRLVTLGAFWGQDFSDVTPLSSGETHLVISESAFNIEYVMVMIGFDGVVGGEIYTIIDAPRATLQKSGDIQFNDDGVAIYPVTLQLLKDGTLGYATRVTYAGPGFAPLAAAFGQVSAIVVTPATAALAVAATQQLVVTDSDGTNVTALASYVSGTPANATVNSSGLVTAVAAGTSTITATYLGETDTCVVTVS